MTDHSPEAHFIPFDRQKQVSVRDSHFGFVAGDAEKYFKTLKESKNKGTIHFLSF